MKKLLFILILFSACKKIQDSEKRTGGWIDRPSNAKVITSANRNTTLILPILYDLIIPTAQNQGQEGACVGFSTTYAATIENYYKTGIMTVFSPEYTYDYADKSSGCGGGTYFTSCLNNLVNKGVCTWSSLPYSDKNGCDSSIAKPYDSEAYQHRISGYSQIWSGDRTAIKTELVNNHPVVIGIVADNSFINAGPGFIWKTLTAGALPHALVIVGYDDNLNAYKVLNSWGTNWGDNGTSHIDYTFYESRQMSGYWDYVIDSIGSTIIIPPPPPSPAPESINLSVTKSTFKGKTTDNLNWNIAVNNTPISSEIDYSTDNINFSFFLNIALTGTYSYQTKVKQTRYYRIKVVKNDGSLFYSQTQNVK